MNDNNRNGWRQKPGNKILWYWSDKRQLQQPNPREGETIYGKKFNLWTSGFHAEKDMEYWTKNWKLDDIQLIASYKDFIMASTQNGKDAHRTYLHLDGEPMCCIAGDRTLKEILMAIEKDSVEVDYFGYDYGMSQILLRGTAKTEKREEVMELLKTANFEPMADLVQS